MYSSRALRVRRHCPSDHSMDWLDVTVTSLKIGVLATDELSIPAVLHKSASVDL